MTPAAAPLVFLDTETTGLGPDRQIWEFAAIRRDAGGDAIEHHMFLDVDLADADPHALKIGGFYDRHPTGRELAALEPASPMGMLLPGCVAAARIAAVTHGAVIVGMNPSFDTEALDRLLRRHQYAPAWHYRPICASALLAGYLRAAHIDVDVPWSSDTLAAYVTDPPSPSSRHTALGDARWAMRVYDTVMRAEVGAVLADLP